MRRWFTRRAVRGIVVIGGLIVLYTVLVAHFGADDRAEHRQIDEADDGRVVRLLSISAFGAQRGGNTVLIELITIGSDGRDGESITISISPDDADLTDGLEPSRCYRHPFDSRRTEVPC